MDKKAYTNRYNNVYKVQVVKQHKKNNINYTSIPLIYDTAEGNALFIPSTLYDTCKT